MLQRPSVRHRVAWRIQASPASSAPAACLPTPSLAAKQLARHNCYMKWYQSKAAHFTIGLSALHVLQLFFRQAYVHCGACKLSPAATKDMSVSRARRHIEHA